MKSILSAMLRIFGQAFFALTSFFVLLVLFGLFVISLGMGIGTGISMDNGLGDMATDEPPGYTHVTGDKNSKNRLLAVSIEGVILGAPSDNMGTVLGLSGVTYGYRVQELLEKAAADDSVKGIWLHLKTPGGTIFGARAIFDGIRAYREKTSQPALVYIEGLSASGGVMAMVGADAIYADHGSSIGSIGVIGGIFTYFDQPVATEGGLFGGGIATEGGIEFTVVSAGRGKDLGNPFRRPTEEELATLQTGIDHEYDLFVRHVADQRGIDERVIRDQMGAQVFGNQAAKDFGLIDGTLNRPDSIAKLAELAQLGEDYQLVRSKEDKSRFWQNMFSVLTGDYRPQPALSVNTDEICRALTNRPLVYHGNLSGFCF